jgi:hypothetical protein
MNWWTFKGAFFETSDHKSDAPINPDGRRFYKLGKKYDVQFKMVFAAIRELMKPIIRERI